jgi:hypothetical protein
MQLTCPQPPPLPDVEPLKLDEIRRTAHIKHLPKDVSKLFSYINYEWMLDEVCLS